MGFHRTSMGVHLKQGHVLCAYCQRLSGEATYSELDLNNVFGTKKGKFTRAHLLICGPLHVHRRIKTVAYGVQTAPQHLPATLTGVGFCIYPAYTEKAGSEAKTNEILQANLRGAPRTSFMMRPMSISSGTAPMTSPCCMHS